MDYKCINKWYPEEETSAINVIEHKVSTNFELAQLFDIPNIWKQFLYNVRTAVFHQDHCMDGLQYYHLYSTPFREVTTIFPQLKKFNMMKEMGS